MSQLTKPLTFTVLLSFEAHSLARECRRWQPHPQKAKQVYLNTLAVYAVDFYLRCLGFETEAGQSDSRHRLYLKFMDVADLCVKQLGKLECRPVLPGAQTCQIPPEVRSNRIGYVAVQMNQSLKEATLLGFTRTAAEEVPLGQLSSLAEFPDYLNQIRQAAPSPQAAANLRQWFAGAFEAGWQAVEDLLGIQPEPLAAVRNRDAIHPKPEIKRVKLVDLGMQLGECSAVLAVVLVRKSDESIRVLVQVHPSRGETYLPPQIRLVMLSPSGETLQEVCSRSQDNYIQLKEFEGQAGDGFQIQVALDEVSVTEDFRL